MTGYLAEDSDLRAKNQEQCHTEQNWLLRTLAFALFFLDASLFDFFLTSGYKSISSHDERKSGRVGWSTREARDLPGHHFDSLT